MNTFRSRLQIASLVAFCSLALIITVMPRQHADAADRPFPKYEMTFQKIQGQKDPNYSPGDPGDGCLRNPNAPISHLTTFGFNTVLDQCDGFRTTIRFYLESGSNDAPTLKFRFGTTWQYTNEVGGAPNEMILKPVENFTYDGQPVSPEQYDPNNPTVKDSNGNPVRMSGGSGMYEPFHYVFEDTFGPGDEHIIQFDSYLPAGAGWGGLSWGTGSTGDTAGGSIGATANGLFVHLPAKMDFRYVLHSEYLAARGFDQDAELKKDFDLPGIPERKWATEKTGIEDTSFETIECLEKEGQHLREIRNSQPINEIYADLPYDTPSFFEDKSGNLGLAEWPYSWYIYQDGTWDPKKGLRPMNRNGTSFDPYYRKDGTLMSLPFKPSVESLIADIPGYEYVDNDITIFEKGKFDTDQPEHSYKYLTAPNVLLRRVNGHDTQHFYYTYRPIPGTFELEKSAVRFTWDKAESKAVKKTEPLEGAKFELYEVVDQKTTPCGLTTDMTDTQKVTVCEYQKPQSPAELQQAVKTKKNCHEQTVRKVKLEGTDGSFTTDASGKFKPTGQPALMPGKYLLKEVEAPKDHIIVNEWTPFEIPIQDSEHAGVVHVKAENYLPSTFQLKKTGVNYVWNSEKRDYDKRSKALNGAKFELFEVVNESAAIDGDSALKNDVKEVQVCDYRQPKNGQELRDMLGNTAKNCKTQLVRKLKLGGTDGSFTTQEDGTFTPAGAPSLLPGNYLLKEISAPNPYHILNEWIPFTIYNEADSTTKEPSSVLVDNYITPIAPPVGPPENPDQPNTPAETPDKETPGEQTPPKDETPDKETPGEQTPPKDETPGNNVPPVTDIPVNKTPPPTVSTPRVPVSEAPLQPSPHVQAIPVAEAPYSPQASTASHVSLAKTGTETALTVGVSIAMLLTGLLLLHTSRRDLKRLTRSE